MRGIPIGPLGRSSASAIGLLGKGQSTPASRQPRDSLFSMGKTTVTLIPGDGIGPEVAEATVRVLEAAGDEIEWERHVAGKEAVERFGEPLPLEVLDSIRRNRVALK